MTDLKVVWIPLETHFKFFATQYPIDTIEKRKMSISYNKVMTSLLYLMMYTRLDIALTIDR